MTARSTRIAVLCLGALAMLQSIAGCSDPTQGIVSGSVVVDGKPAETGAISFIPVNGRGTTAGAVIEQGKYKATVPVGEVRIEIRVSKVVGEQKIYDTPDSPIQEVMEESLPARFNDQSELTWEVPSGKSTKDFDLQTAE